MNEGRFPQVGDSIFFCLLRLYLGLRGTAFYGPVRMIPGQLIASVHDPGVNFASVHGLTLVTVHMNFSLQLWGNFERRITRCTTPGNLPCRDNFSPCEENAKVAPGQEWSCACSLLMFTINFPINSSRKHKK